MGDFVVLNVKKETKELFRDLKVHPRETDDQCLNRLLDKSLEGKE